MSSKGNILCRLIKFELYKIFAIINRAIKGLHCIIVFTHWGQATHVSKLNQCWIIANWTTWNKFQWNFNWDSNIFIQENEFQNVVWKVVVILSPIWILHIILSWWSWRDHNMDTLSILLLNFLVPHNEWTSNENIFFVVSMNKLLNKQLGCQWFEMPKNSCDITLMIFQIAWRARNPGQSPAYLCTFS